MNGKKQLAKRQKRVCVAARKAESRWAIRGKRQHVTDRRPAPDVVSWREPNWAMTGRRRIVRILVSASAAEKRKVKLFPIRQGTGAKESQIT